MAERLNGASDAEALSKMYFLREIKITLLKITDQNAIANEYNNYFISVTLHSKPLN